MRLIPKGHSFGWVSYALLAYAGFFLIDPIADHAGLVVWAWTGLGIGIFLALYFASYWACGWQSVALSCGMALLGAAYLPFNGGASCFFIYAASFFALEKNPRLALRLLAGLLAFMSAELYLLHRPAMAWIMNLGLAAMVGMINFYFSQQGREQSKLLRAQEEIENLAKIAERERIARDMHDVLGHTLSVIILKSELASKLVELAPERAKAEMVDVEETARAALQEVRLAIGGYKSKGLRAEIAGARATLETAGVSVECLQEAVKLSAAQESVLALALREAVTNVVRHAGARRCRVELKLVDGLCVLLIEDDGRGGAMVEGNGLSGMRERVESIGGTLRRESRGGTRLRISVPLAADTVPARLESDEVLAVDAEGVRA